jgi:hypothetical protein
MKSKSRERILRNKSSRLEPLNGSVGAPVCDRLCGFAFSKAGCKPALRFMRRASAEASTE